MNAYDKNAKAMTLEESNDHTARVHLVQPKSLIATLEERGKRYGVFSGHADITQSLKEILHNTTGWDRLNPSQKESLEMIVHKIGRILNGDPHYDDSWRDIAGYAKLVEDELNGVIR